MSTAGCSAQLRRTAALIGFVASLMLIGCGPRQQTAKPVDADQARSALETVLTDWTKGGKPEAWMQRVPQVVIQDADWARGAKLRTFEILGPGEPRDANLFCRVKLVLEEPSAQPAEQTVTYCVGSDPVITVFRDFTQ